jgi:hypothetical protein
MSQLYTTTHYTQHRIEEEEIYIYIKKIKNIIIMNKGHIIFGYDLVFVVIFFFFFFAFLFGDDDLRVLIFSFLRLQSSVALHHITPKRKEKQKTKPKKGENENIWSCPAGRSPASSSSPFLAKVRDFHISQRSSKNKKINSL